MQHDFAAVQAGRERQLLQEDAVHRWYRFVLSFPDHLVSDLCDRFSVKPGETVLDPFSGTGTTLVECKRLGINAVGIEANPACAFASMIKTRWTVDPNMLREKAEEIIRAVRPDHDTLSAAEQPLFALDPRAANQVKTKLNSASPEARHFIESGMLKRGWMSPIPFYKSVSLLEAIKAVDVPDDVREALKLATIAVIVESASNVSFGPELYVKGRKVDVDVAGAFLAKVDDIASDLEQVWDLSWGKAIVLEGDARRTSEVLHAGGIDSVDYVITSPPYPTEKDYTRQTRLELVFLGIVHDRKSLQRVKKAMVRSHSKGIYAADTDGQHVEDVPEVKAIADELREKIKDKTYGFAKLYPRIIEEYFGGMHRHLLSLRDVLRPGGRCAYVVGDQRTYLQTYTPTGKLIAQLAERVGYTVEEVLTWRVRVGTTGSGRSINEEIVILKR